GGRAGVAGDVGRVCADRVVAVCERRRRDRVGARGAAVVAGGAVEELDAGAILGRAGEARRRVAGDVVVVEAAAVGARLQVGRRGRRRGGRVGRGGEPGGGDAGVAGAVGRPGADRVGAVVQRRGRDRVGARRAAAVAGAVDEELDAGAVLGAAAEARRRVAGDVVAAGGARVAQGVQ